MSAPFVPDLPKLWRQAWGIQQAQYATRHHGIDHWVRVERNGLWLARELPGIDILVVRLFAGLHDCKRFDDGWDREHGPRAAEFIEGLELPLRPDRLDRLITAVRTHTDTDRHDDPTIQVCYDADRLDLGRVGTRPDPRFLNTDPAKDLAARDACELLDAESFELTLPEFWRPTPRWDRGG